MQFFGKVSKLDGESVLVQTNPPNSPAVFRDYAQKQVALGKSRRRFDQGFPQVIDAAAAADAGEVGSMPRTVSIQPMAPGAVSSAVVNVLPNFWITR